MWRKMGKTKTAFVSDTVETSSKGRSASGRKKETEKVHLAGQKGGERVKMVDAPTSPLATEGQASKKQKIAKIRGQKYQEARSKVDRNKLYTAKDAIALAKETSISKFEGTLELHLVVKKEGLSANVVLPYQSGRAKKVEVADESTIKKLESGKVDFDVLLATAEMMPRLVPFARLLGPKGLMPNPKTGTLIKDVKDAGKFNTSKVTIKTEKAAPLIHTVVGKLSMKPEELLENLEAILNALNRKLVVKAYLKATMGPSVKVAVE
jgi:large subunit ribosomal protein L1